MSDPVPPVPSPSENRPAPLSVPGNSTGNDLLICTPVDELVAQIRQVVRWVWTLRWWLLLGVTIGAGCGAVLGLTLLRSNTAYSTFRVLTAQHENPLGKFSREAIRFFGAPTNIFPSETLVAKTLERLDQRAPTPNQIYETRRRLDIIDFGQDIFEVSFRDRDANRALNFLTTHLKVYAEKEIESNLDTLRLEVGRIKDTLTTVGERMNRNQERARAFRSENAESLPEFAQEHMQNMRGLERKVTQLEAEAADLSIERAHLEERLQVEPASILVETRERREQVDVTAAAAARLSALHLQINELRSRGLRDAHPSLKRLLVEQELLTRSPEKVLEQAPASAAPSPKPAPSNADPLTVAGMLAAKRSGNRGLHPTAGADLPGSSDATLVENRPNERRVQMLTRLDSLTVKADQLARQIADARIQLTKARNTVVNMPLLEKQFAELSRNQTADLSTYQQVAMVLEMAEFQLKLEQDAAPSRLELFNPPRLRFSSQMMKLAIVTGVGAMIGFALAGLIWSLLTLRRLVWPQGVIKGIVQDATGSGTP